jgi:hypothetical protein
MSGKITSKSRIALLEITTLLTDVEALRISSRWTVSDLISIAKYSGKISSLKYLFIRMIEMKSFVISLLEIPSGTMAARTRFLFVSRMSPVCTVSKLADDLIMFNDPIFMYKSPSEIFEADTTE